MTRINVTDWLQRLFESKPPRRQSGGRWAATNPLPNCPAEQLEERIVFSTSTLAAAIVPLAERTGPVIRVVEVVEVAEVIDGQLTAVDFGSTIQRSSGATRLFTVTNRGTSNLNLGRVSVPRGFELTEPLSTRLTPGQSDSFTIALKTILVGDFNGNVEFSTNVRNVQTFNFPIRGRVDRAIPPEVRTPEIAVSIDGQTLTTTSTTIRPVLYTNAGQRLIEQITVRNDGTADLFLSQWSISTGFLSDTPTHLRPTESVTISLSLTTSALVPGIKTGTLSFSTNDADEPSYTIDIRAKVYAPPREIVAGRAIEVGPDRTLNLYGATYVSIDLPNGRVRAGTTSVITVRDANGRESRLYYNNILRVVIHRDPGTIVPVDNFQQLLVEFAR